MMLDLAQTLNPLLDAREKRLEEGEEEDEDVEDTTLQLVFFDGEEAFVDWTDTDSIYGARYEEYAYVAEAPEPTRLFPRHLAERWSGEFAVPGSKRRSMGAYLTEIQTIEHLILLDLLGSPDPLLRSYFLDTAWMFDALISAEKRLGDSGAFAFDDNKSMAPGKWKSYFRPRKSAASNMGHVGDDHVPFLNRGVSVLHLIAEPFPRVWHTVGVRVPLFFRFVLALTSLTTGRRIRTGYSDYAEMEPSTSCLHVRVPQPATKRLCESHSQRAGAKIYI